tara:strand:- start:4344 stop:5588 length:1245 start_codon:yes stop_codon:yes gene_type:complete
MTFTPLHRALGLAPSPLTDDILDSAVGAGVKETDDLDWKSELPPIKNLSQGDVPKDIAAMANSGGGMIIYGVEEDQKSATRRKSVGELTEIHERAYRSAAVTAISPPIFGLGVHRLGTDPQAVAVVAPASVDGPHLVYKNDLFGAPIRNDADTAWMKERQIEAMYRARFDERRRTSDAVDTMYNEAAEGRDSQARAWFVAVAHPRVPVVLSRPDRHEISAIFERAETVSLSISRNHGVHPLNNMDGLNPRPGLRRWTAVNKAASEPWKESWADVHHDGSVTVAAALGGHRMNANAYFEGWQVEGRGLETGVADFAALVRAVSEAQHLDEYEVRVGVVWDGEQPLQVLDVDGMIRTYVGTSTTLRRFVPIRSTINAAGSDESFHREVFRLAEDCVNQGGITSLNIMMEPSINPED